MPIYYSIIYMLQDLFNLFSNNEHIPCFEIFLLIRIVRFLGLWEYFRIVRFSLRKKDLSVHWRESIAEELGQKNG